MRVIVACAGRSPKWERPLPPHLTLVDRRPLLVRTVEQVRHWTADVHVTCPAGDARYRVAGAMVHERDPGMPSEYASTRDLWNPAGRTVLLLGDVYFTDAAIRRIMSEQADDLRVFGRYGPSRITGTPYGEIFAAAWTDRQHALLDKHLDVVHRTRAAGTVTRPPGWMLLRSWCGLPLGRHRVRQPTWVEVDDLTDDVDREDDLRRHPAFRGGAGAGG